MKNIAKILFIVSLALAQCAHGQSSFVNLDFESANVTGYSPDSTIPITSALPGWSGFYGINQVSQVGYDALSIGGVLISVVDNNVAVSSLDPIQGAYSVCLFGGSSDAAIISQTGVVPSGTKSLLMDLSGSGQSLLIVSLGGQIIQLVPIATFQNYTEYGGNIATFAGQPAELSLTEPGPAGAPPSVLELDNIQFSPSVIPEPATCALVLCGATLLGLSRWKRT